MGYWAAEGGLWKVASVTCREGCGCGGHVTSQLGQTALVLAVRSSRKDTVELLLDHGADMEAKTRVSQMRHLF